jgi:hypothetical protein
MDKEDRALNLLKNLFYDMAEEYVNERDVSDDEYDSELGMSLNEAVEKIQDHTKKVIANARARLLNKCSACGGAFHIATGHCWTESCVLCMRCTKDFIQWLKGREGRYSKPWRKDKTGSIFIEAALTSIGAKR